MHAMTVPGDSAPQQSQPSPQHHKTVGQPQEKNTSEGSEFLDDATRMDDADLEAAGFSEE